MAFDLLSVFAFDSKIDPNKNHEDEWERFFKITYVYLSLF